MRQWKGAVAALLVSLMMVDPASAAQALKFSDLRGWAGDDHAAALRTFRSTCSALKGSAWAKVCAEAKAVRDPRKFFETRFRPVLIGGSERALFTGYYEPEIRAARTATGPYRYPIYRKPPEMKSGRKWLSRGEIETSGVLNGRGLEIAYLSDPVEVFFLQVQGSGRLKMPDETTLRVGFAAKNGHKYRSVGRELVRRGHYKAHQVSANTIKKWVMANGNEGQRLLHHNPSFIFFRELDKLPPEKGPLGAMNRSVTAGRSIAVDKQDVPLGAPVWIEKEGAAPMRRLMIAQDTGSAIKGPQRADIFYGTGDQAGRAAGRVRDGGRLIQLWPVEMVKSVSKGN